MGGSYYYVADKEKEDAIRIGKAVIALKSHPNYKDKVPFKGETQIQFTLRCIAHLVSPPMQEVESNEIECTDLSNAILAMEKEISEIWKRYKQ